MIHILARFEIFIELHYSQTRHARLDNLLSFETFTELHYSQTRTKAISPPEAFETFTELHYSQTPNPKYESKVPKLVQSPPSVIL